MKLNNFLYRPKSLALEHSMVQKNNLVQQPKQREHKIKDLKMEEADKHKKDRNQLKQLLKLLVENQKLLRR